MDQSPNLLGLFFFFSKPLEIQREPEAWLLGSIIPPRVRTDTRVAGMWNEEWQ